MNPLYNFMKSFATGAFLLLHTCGFSQTYYFDNYSVSEGLAQSKVYDIIQDRNDYIWLGTGGGVSRFDGVSIENFTSEEGLALNGVRAIFEASNGFLWFGHTGGGITRFDGRRFEVFEDTSIIISSDITSINQAPGGDLWITSDGSGALQVLNPDAPLSELRHEWYYQGRGLSDRVFSMFAGKDSTLYFVIDIPRVLKKDPGSDEFQRLQIEGMAYFQITCFIEDSKGNYWIGTHNDGLYKFNRETQELNFYNTRNGLAFNFPSTLYEDSGGIIWVGTWGGGVTCIQDGKLKTFNQDNGLPDLKIWSIMEDVEGNILIGTNENGLCIFKGEHFVSFSEEDGLVNNQVWAVLQDRTGKFWFGTNGGLSTYDPDRPEGKEFQTLTRTSRYEVGNQIRFLKEDAQGHIWIGTYDNGVTEYNPGNGRFSYSIRINSYNQQLLVTAMEIDPDNKLWVGTTAGLIYYDIDRGQVQYLSTEHGLGGMDISAIYADSKGILWVGSRGKGITTIEGDSIRQLVLEDDFTPTCFAESAGGRIWVGTEGQGVFAIEEMQLVRHLTRQDGLLANLITLVNIDDNENVFIGTNKGLNKYVPSEDKVYTYMEKNGFVGIETKNNASFLDPEGNIWFGTVDGVIKFDPSKERRIGTDPLTHITRMRVNLEDREMVQGLKLGFKENSVIFDFRSICLTNPDAVSYRYKMQGADVDWLPITEQTTATYPALRPGKYIFQVRASNSDGFWNEVPISYSFQIRPPFYATWYFIASCIILGAIAIFSYIKIRTRALIRKNLILEEKVRARTAQVVAQKEELAQKNKDITDSIQYARRIQFAILPPEIPFGNTFVLFKPKDIVSGDFYWLVEMSGKEFIAAVDCTGHGVPGAFMSIIGHNMLNKVVKEYGIDKPSKILQQLDNEVTKTLHQKEDRLSVKDGMDMTLIAYQKDKRVLEFAGAYNPIYLIRNGELIETKGDRFAIGRSIMKAEKEFTNHEINIQEGDTIYMFSDGYADQFGGEKGKKFKIQPMKELIMSIQDKSMEEQRSILDSTIEAWRGDIEQIDDILIIGRRF